ncbi:hypothetical protein [Micromonospora arborensis]|uniref:hypothetical protein n=1 Tax=Micromonospora arborensis TaxID=2116518 RepID=UPI003719566F
MLAWVWERYRPQVAIAAAVLVLAALWTLVGLIGYGLWLLVLALLNALAGWLA